MGLLDDLLAGAASGAGPGRPAQPQRGAGGPNAALLALLPIVLSMLANRGAAGGGSRESGPAGGLGDLLGQMMGAGQRGGGLGDILGQVLGGGAAGGGSGGLGGLLRQFESAGFGEQARSWVSPGQNQPLPTDALGRVFGQDGLATIARMAGLSESETSTGLAQLLPEVIDRATPQGRIPDDDQLAGSLQDLLRRLGG